MRAGALVLAGLISACTFSPPGAGSAPGEDATPGELDAAAPGLVDGPPAAPDAELVDGPPPPPIDAVGDADGDGVFDDLDNCAIANPVQHDADGDGLGDACDPTCSPVGLGTSTRFGPGDTLGLDTARINGAARPNVAPGSTVSLSVRYTARRSPACPGCITQIYWGLDGERAPIACPFSETISGGGESGNSSADITASTVSGVYYLRGDWSWEGECQDEQFLDDPGSPDDDGTRYAAFCVIDPS